MSIVSSENLACSHAEPTIKISCKLSVICGDRSHGGVVSGLSLEPEPLACQLGGVNLLEIKHRMARAFECDDSKKVCVWYL